jgi:hypothetical protein
VGLQFHAPSKPHQSSLSHCENLNLGSDIKSQWVDYDPDAEWICQWTVFHNLACTDASVSKQYRVRYYTHLDCQLDPAPWGDWISDGTAQNDQSGTCGGS